MPDTRDSPPADWLAFQRASWTAAGGAAYVFDAFVAEMPFSTYDTFESDRAAIFAAGPNWRVALDAIKGEARNSEAEFIRDGVLVHG
jgi:hypothetical protein